LENKLTPTPEFHPLEMRARRHLAMLQCMAVVGPRVFAQGLLNRIKRHIGAFIAIGVTCT
jgi:hypothetical protein